MMYSKVNSLSLFELVCRVEGRVLAPPRVWQRARTRVRTHRMRSRGVWARAGDRAFPRDTYQ